MRKKDSNTGIITGRKVSCEVRGFKVHIEVPVGADAMTAARKQINGLYNGDQREIKYGAMIIHKLQLSLDSNCLERAEL